MDGSPWRNDHSHSAMIWNHLNRFQNTLCSNSVISGSESVRSIWLLRGILQLLRCVSCSKFWRFKSCSDADIIFCAFHCFTQWGANFPAAGRPRAASTGPACRCRPGAGRPRARTLDDRTCSSIAHRPRRQQVRGRSAAAAALAGCRGRRQAA